MSRKRAPAPAPPARRPFPLPLLLIGLLGALALLYYWPVLIGAPAGKAWFWEDFLEQNYPYRFFQATYMSEGIFPLWNPYIFGGLPFGADIHAGPFYPPHWVLALFVRDGRLPPEAAEALQVLHVLIGGLFMGLLARSYFGGRAGPLIAGIGFAFSAVLVVRMKHSNILESTVWLPGVLLFLREAIRRHSLAAVGISALLLGISLLAGAPQHALFALIAAAVLVLFEIGAEKPGRSWLRAIAAFGVVVAVAAMLAGATLLPLLELTGQTLRENLNYEASTEGSFHPKYLTTFLLPRYFGSTAGGQNRGFFGDPYYFFWELACYVGLPVLMLAAVGLFRPIDRRAGAVAAVGLIGLLLALGKYGPLHPLLYHLLEPYQRFRMPGRAIFLTVVALLLLAARGAARLESGLLKTPSARRGLLAVAVALVAAIAAAAGLGMVWGPPAARAGRLFSAMVAVVIVAATTWVARQSGRGRRRSFPWVAALIGVLMLDLSLFGIGYNLGSRNPADAVFGKRNIVDFLQEKLAGEPFRVSIRCPEGILLLRNAGSLLRVATVDGYNQLRLRRSHELMSSPQIGRARQLSLWSVLYATQPGSSPGSLALARNPAALPRARLVHRSEVYDDDEKMLQALARPDRDPAEVVALQEGEAQSWTRPPAESPPRFVRFEPNRIELEVDAAEPGFLVLTDPFYPGWEATVNGEPVPVLRADYALRAVELGKGQQRVEFRFRPASVRNGLLLSALGLLLCLGLILRPGSRSRALLADIFGP